VEAHDGSDDEQTSTVVTDWTADTGNGPLSGPELSHAEPGDARATDGRPSDAALIERSRQEPDCFAGIFDRHADEILRYAHARLGPDLAEDITAETFLAAFRRRDHYDLAWADARPWLYGIAIRLIGKHRRAEGRYRRMLRTVPADGWNTDEGDRSADRVTAQQLRPRLVAVLDALPSRDRELLLLVAWAGLSYEEAARALDLTVSAVRSRLHRIRVKTRTALGGADPTQLIEENDRG
jgi:RNA polymerase sigma factor (sigma-70 family)